MKKIFTFKNKRSMPKPLAWLLALLLKLYSWTFRIEYDDPDGWLTEEKHLASVYVMWHNRILFLPAVPGRKVLRWKNVLVSSSRDGEYISAIVKFFGLGVVRGSSSRGALHALLELGRKLRENESVVLTVDGPRGPRYTVHSGAPRLAQKFKVPIVPVSLNASSRWELHSWDGTQIPKPFSKVTVRVGNVFVPDENASDVELQAKVAESLHKIDGMEEGEN